MTAALVDRYAPAELETALVTIWRGLTDYWQRIRDGVDWQGSGRSEWDGPWDYTWAVKRHGDLQPGGAVVTSADVRLARQAAGQWSLRASWNRQDPVTGPTTEQREVVAFWQPPKWSRLLPTAEVGCRDGRVGDTHLTPSVFASAKVQPTDALEVSAELAPVTPSGSQPSDQHSLQVQATQKLGQGGQAKARYAETSADRTGSLALREFNLDLASPKDWLVPGLSLHGRYSVSYRPGSADAPDELTNKHEASVGWQAGQTDELLATFRLDTTYHGSQRDAARRVELRYKRRVFDSTLNVTGSASDGTGAARDSEQYRVGVDYSLPF